MNTLNTQRGIRVHAEQAVLSVSYTTCSYCCMKRGSHYGVKIVGEGCRKRSCTLKTYLEAAQKSKRVQAQLPATCWVSCFFFCDPPPKKKRMPAKRRFPLNNKKARTHTHTPCCPKALSPTRARKIDVRGSKNGKSKMGHPIGTWKHGPKPA